MTTATPPSPEDIVRRLEIRGVVQGVGFRWSMVDEAARLGIRGWVRNRRDGSVEAVVCGPAPAVERLVAWARHGPRGSAVASVDVFDAAAEGFASFGMRPTA